VTKSGFAGNLGGGGREGPYGDLIGSEQNRGHKVGAPIWGTGFVADSEAGERGGFLWGG